MNHTQTPSTFHSAKREPRTVKGVDFTLIHPADAPAGTLEDYINDQGIPFQLKIIEINPMAVKMIENPSPRVQIAAVTKDPTVFRHIKNPCEEAVCLYLKHNPSHIFHLKEEVTEGMLIEALRADPAIFAFIQQPWSERIEDLYTALIGRHG